MFGNIDSSSTDPEAIRNADAYESILALPE
jgi:hypothetical protein